MTKKQRLKELIKKMIKEDDDIMKALTGSPEDYKKAIDNIKARGAEIGKTITQTLAAQKDAIPKT